MDPERFDRIAQLVGVTPSRRHLLAMAAAWAVGKMANASIPAYEDVTAKRKKHRRKQHSRHAAGKPGRNAAGDRGDKGGVVAEGKPRPPLESVVKPLPEGTHSCGLQPYNTQYEGSRYKGTRDILVDAPFRESLNKINKCANDADVDLEQGSTFRGVVDENWDIYKRIKWNNHVPGHAIDFKSIDGCGWITRDDCANIKQQQVTNGTLAPPPLDSQGKAQSVRDFYCRLGSDCLGQELEDYPPKVEAFFRCIMKTPGLRWGGKFGDGYDPIHIDDGINKGLKEAYTNPDPRLDEYRERVNVTAYSGSCPSGQSCNEKTGLCEAGCDPPCADDRVCRNKGCECRDGSSECGGVCVNTTGNDHQCGSCDNDCTVSNKTCCGTTCIDTKTDLDHCGACDELCGVDGCCDGVCTDLQNQDNHCGACDNDCTIEPCQMCRGGACVPITCPAGSTCCNNACVANCPAGAALNETTCKCAWVCGGATNVCSNAPKSCGPNNSCICRNGFGDGGSVCTSAGFLSCIHDVNHPCNGGPPGTPGACGSGSVCITMPKSCCGSGTACAGRCAGP